MWTRLVAGAAAHDINNVAQGFSNLLSLASAPTISREVLDRYAALARDGLKELRQLGTDLRVLANTGGDADSDETQRLDLLTVEAVGDLDVPRDRTLDVSPLDAGAVVVGSRAALRLAIQALVRYSIAASAPRGGVSVSVSLDEATAAVVVAAPSAPAPHADADAELGTLLAGVAREFGGDVGLVLAGAAAHLSAGTIWAGRAPGGGLRFKLSLPRV